MLWIVSNTLDDTETLCAPFTEQNPVSNGQELRMLDEAKRNQRSISSAYKGAIKVNNCACLTDCTDMKHGLVLWTDSGRVR